MLVWKIILVGLFIGWVVFFIKTKKALLILPYLLLLFVTPIYNILDQRFFIQLFGCGCVPSVQSNVFNIPFNANDLRFMIYVIFNLILFALSFKYSKGFYSKRKRIFYILSILLFNILLTLKILQLYMWN